MPQIPNPYYIVKILNEFLPFPFFDSMIMFFVYAFIGWVVEVCYYGVTEGRFINRGFLGGPICPVYGLGFYGVITFFRPFVGNFPLLFFGSALVATTVELLAGVILYWIFHLRWWDYSEYKWNLKGFICLRFSIYWGIACSLGMYILHPSVSGIIGVMPRLLKHILVLIMTTGLVVDIVLSVCGIFEFNKKVKVIGKLLGGMRFASDRIGEQIYDTVDNIVTKTTPAVETTQQGYSEFRELYTKHRKEEKELARAHREEERELLASYVGIGKEALQKTKDTAAIKMAVAMSQIRRDEINIISRIRTSTADINNNAIRFLKSHFDDSYDSSREYEKENMR